MQRLHWFLFSSDFRISSVRDLYLMVNLCGGRMKGRVHVTQICDEVTDVSGSLVVGIRYAPVYMTQVSSSKPQLFFFLSVFKFRMVFTCPHSFLHNKDLQVVCNSSILQFFEPTNNVVICLDFLLTNRALWLVDSWSLSPDQIQMYPDRDTILSCCPWAEYNSMWSVHD